MPSRRAAYLVPSMTIAIRVVVADDHPIVRSGVRALGASHQDIIVVAEAASVDEAEAALLAHRPNVLVLDLQMPGGGLEAIRRLRESSPETRILVLTMHEDPANVAGAFREGAAGYLVKRATNVQIVEAMRVVARGERFLDPALAGGDGEAGSGGVPASVSPRERQVLALVARGYTNKEVGDLLQVSVKTVETYRSRVIEKLGLKSRAELVRFAIEHGLLDRPPGDEEA